MPEYDDLPAGAKVVGYSDLPPGAKVVGQATPKQSSGGIGDFVSEAWDKFNPVKGAVGLADAISHPVRTTNAYVENIGNSLQQAKDAFDRGDYLTAARHAIMAGSPLEEQADQLQRGETAKGLGGLAGIGAGFMAPKVIESVGPKLGKAAEGLYRRALRPAGEYADRTRAVKAGLREEAPVTQPGLDKAVRQNVQTESDLGQRIAQGTQERISGSTGRAVQATRVVEADYSFPRDVTGSASRDMVQQVRSEFLDNLRATRGGVPRDMTGQEMHLAKRGIYKKIRNKQGYAPETAADKTEAALASSFVRDVKANFPHAAELLEREGGQIELIKQLQRSIANQGNLKPLGYGAGGAVVGALGDVLMGGSGMHGGVYGLTLGYGIKAIQSPAVMSKLAILLHKAEGIPISDALAKATAYGAQLGNQLEEVVKEDDAKHAKQ